MQIQVEGFVWTEPFNVTFVKIYFAINVLEFPLNHLMLYVKVLQMREYHGFVCITELVSMV